MLQPPERPVPGQGRVRGFVMVYLRGKYISFFYLAKPQVDKKYFFQTQCNVFLILESFGLLTKKAKNLRPGEPGNFNAV